MEITFGKYKGNKIENLPYSYLNWIYETFDKEKYAGLLRAIKAEMDKRDKEDELVIDYGLDEGLLEELDCDFAYMPFMI